VLAKLNKNPYFYFFLFTGLIMASYRLLPWQEWLGSFIDMNNDWIKLIRAIILNVFWGVIIVGIIIKNRFLFMNRFSVTGLLFVPFLLLVTYIYSGGFKNLLNVDFSSVPQNELLIYSINNISIGFLEEVLFRGLILGASLYMLIGQSNFLKKSIWISSVLFGILHFINAYSPDIHYENIFGLVNNVIFALGFGLLFASLYIKIRTVSVVIFLHALHNWITGLSIFVVSNADVQELNQNKGEGIDWASTIVGFVMMSIPLILGIILMRFINEKDEEYVDAKVADLKNAATSA
jgi:membrane protease YdiL (CAAX protease family)